MMNAELIRSLSADRLIALGEFECSCGRKHGCSTKHAVIRKGAVQALPGLLNELGSKKPFLLSGEASFAAAGDTVTSILDCSGIPYSLYVLPDSPVVPDERTVGAAVMHYDPSCDCIIGIGSGVINDTGKILASLTGSRYLIVATAPSMDGFASATSSMDMDGLKVSLNSTAAWAIIGDTELLAAAPDQMLQAGVGDMLAKYISLTEWKIANLIVDEYYCPTVSALVDSALEKVISAAGGLKRREPEAVGAVMEGLVIAGLAMKYAGLSRPASGMEHYFSHIWDMRALAFPECRARLHGIQTGIATLYSLKVYDYIRNLQPDREKALRSVQQFDLPAWNHKLRAFIGPGAEAMIQGEQKEGKYTPEKHAPRLERILRFWPDILSLIDGLPAYQEILDLMRSIGAPTSAAEFGYTEDEIRTVFTMTKDIRDKYIASRLLWDLGELEQARDAVSFSEA